MGEIRFAQQEFKEASAALRGFLDGDSPDPKLVPKALFHLGVSLFRQNIFDQAAVTFKRLLKESPEDPLARDAHYNLVLSEQKAGKLRESIEDGESFLKAHPGAAEEDFLYLQLGQMHKSLGNIKEAKEALNRVKNTSPSAIEAYYMLGQINQEQGDYRKALAAYKRLVPLRPHNNNLHISDLALLAEAYEQAGEFNESLKLYEEVANFGKNPDWRQAAKQKIPTIMKQIQGGKQ
jgi:tetratricopeptide (TPR) repeat protein